MKFSKYGTFHVYINGVYLMTLRCSYGHVLDLVWPIYHENPASDIEIIEDCD